MKLHTPNVRIIVLAVLLCLAWTSGVWFYELNQFKLRTNKLIDRLDVDGAKRGEAISADIRRSLKSMYGLPELLASLQEIRTELQSSQFATNTVQLLKKINPDNKSAQLMHINQLLALTAKHFSTDVIWLLDIKGNCIAASNFDLPGTFVGKNFKEQTYFSSAMNGEKADQFAIDDVNGQPGLYFSAPVYIGAAVTGVVVVKIDVARLAQRIDITNAFLVDENGVVILADEPHFVMKSLPDSAISSMSAARRKAIYQRDQFEVLRIAPWPDPRYVRLIRLQNSLENSVANSSDAYALNITSIDDGLKIYVLSPANEILSLGQDYFRLFLLITLCGTTLVIIAVGIILYLHASYANRQLLRMQHNELKEAQHLAQMGSWSYDYVREQLYCSDEFKTNFLMVEGDTIKPTLDHAALAHIHPDDQIHVKQVFKEALKNDHGYSIEYRLVRKNGEIRNVEARAVVEKDAKGNKLKVAGTVRDITEEKRVMHALEESENHLRKVMNSSLIGIIQGENDFIQYMNNAFISLTGYTPAYLMDRRLTWQDIAAPEYQWFDSKHIFGQTNTPAPFEMELTCCNNRTVQVLVGMSKMENSRSEWVCFVLDLSERNRMNRLKSEFISLVSHELRTPLTSIHGSLALLEKGVTGDLGEKSLELVKIAHRNSRRLIDIVNDILDSEKLAAGKMSFDMKSIEFTEVIKQAIESNEAFATQLNVNFVITDLPESAYIWGDANRLIQIITNLLSNAAKFSPKGGKVELRLIMLNRHWRLEVQDYGSGIPVAFRPRLFEAFAQAEDANTRQKSGTGLGLNITKIMVEKMNGHIGFESEVGKGALFWISFAVL